MVALPLMLSVFRRPWAVRAYVAPGRELPVEPAAALATACEGCSQADAGRHHHHGDVLDHGADGGGAALRQVNNTQPAYA
jgi:hypothetical protein